MLQNRAKEAESAIPATQVERPPPNQPANQQPTHTHTPPNTPKPSKMPAGTVNKSTTEGRKTRAGTATDISLAGGTKDVKNATEGRKYLEKYLLLCPPGCPITYTLFSSCLQQISRMSGITKTIATAIQSIALLADEFEETSINETVRDAVTSQLSELTSDVKLLIDDAKQKIDEHHKGKLHCKVLTTHQT